MHVGMAKKPLEPYNPKSYRNRLPTADVKKPVTNSSQIEFGDRGYQYFINSLECFITNISSLLIKTLSETLGRSNQSPMGG